MSKDKVADKLRQAKELGINTGNPAALAAFANGNIDDALTASIPGGIEASEALGQQELVKSQQLPKDCLLEHREQLEKLGFVFGEEIDDVFVAVKLPAGWTKKPTDHSMWSDLLDDQGRKRAGIFYKAAFYDRNGHMSWEGRYRVNIILADGRDPYDIDREEEADFVGVVTDGNTEIFRTEVCRTTRDDCDTSDKLRQQVCEWLEANRQNCSDPFLSWDN